MSTMILVCALSVVCASVAFAGVVPEAAVVHAKADYGHTPFSYNGNYGGKTRLMIQDRS